MSDTDKPIIIIGGGQAAVQLCLALRKEKVSLPILMLSEESEYPYHRPPLSKSFLSGETEEEKLAMRPASFYTSKEIDLQLNTYVTKIDPAGNKVFTDKGEFTFHSLIIATGARPRPLPAAVFSGSEDNANTLGGVHLLRDLQQSKKIKQELESAQNVVVIGAGFIGLEFAAVANKMGKNVTVFDMADRVMARAVAPFVSAWFDERHQADGIDIQLEDSVVNIIGIDKISEIFTNSGKKQKCDLMVVGIGVIPNDELAIDAGLNCDNGIVVNEYCETSIKGIYAAGDCAMHPNPFANNELVRIESIQNATDQARAIAKCIAGSKTSYKSVPWFWSDQGDYSLQMAGLSNNSDQFVTRGDPAEGSFSVYHFSEKIMQSVDSVNSPKDHMIARKLIDKGLSPTPKQAADTEFDLKSLL